MAKIVCAAFLQNDKVLLVRRAAHRKWSPERWDLVGGHVDKGEGLDVAIVRECREEVGLTPLALEHVAILYEDRDPKLKTPFHVYAVRLWQGGAPSLLGTEHSELGWFSRSEISNIDLAFRGYRSAIDKMLSFNGRAEPSPGRRVEGHLPRSVGIKRCWH